LLIDIAAKGYVGNTLL